MNMKENKNVLIVQKPIMMKNVEDVLLENTLIQHCINVKILELIVKDVLMGQIVISVQVI